jgi:hypothetical protein
MQLGTVVKSTGHVDYVCQVYGPADLESPPTPEDYAFGTFVRIGLGDGAGCLVGLISNTLLMNPEFGQLGPRLSPPADLEVFSPDYLSERAVMVAIVAVGRRWDDGSVHQGVPLPAATLGAVVEKMPDDEVRDFHRSDTGPALAYVPLLLTRQDPLIPHLLLGVIDRLDGLFPDHGRQLAVLRGNLAWKTKVLGCA